MSTECPSCGGTREIFSVPAELRRHLPQEPIGVVVCRRCLRLDPVEEETPGPADPTAISTALPTDPEATVALFLLVELLSSLALYRTEIVEIVDYLERAGVDPLLALDRLAADSTLIPSVDLPRRRFQLAQILS